MTVDEVEDLRDRYLLPLANGHCHRTDEPVRLSVCHVERDDVRKDRIVWSGGVNCLVMILLEFQVEVLIPAIVQIGSMVAADAALDIILLLEAEATAGFVPLQPYKLTHLGVALVNVGTVRRLHLQYLQPLHAKRVDGPLKVCNLHISSLLITFLSILRNNPSPFPPNTSSERNANFVLSEVHRCAK